MNHSLKAEMKFAPANFCCLYTCECTFLLPLQSCCLLLLPELGNKHAKLFSFTVNFDGQAIIIIIIEHTTTGASLQR